MPAKGKRIWCEKTTANIEYLSILYKTFPEARYILLFRHCVDVTYSCIKTCKFGFMQELAPYLIRSPENFVVAVLESWIDKTRKLLEFESKNKDRTYRLTYESLVSDPAQILPSLFGFVGVEWDSSILERCFRIHHDYGEGDTKVVFEQDIHTHSIGKGCMVPRDLITDPIRCQADELLMPLGYRSINDYLDFNEKRKGGIEGKLSIHRSQITGVRDLLDQFFAEWAKKARKAASLAGQCCKFIISGVEGGIWIIDPSDPDGIGRNDNQETTCTILLSSDLLLDIVERRQNPVEAYEEGKIEVIGNINAAFEFGQILFT